MDKTGLLEIKKRFKYPDVSFSSMAYAFCPSGGDNADDSASFTGESKFLTREDDEQKAFTGMVAKAFSFGSGTSSADIHVEGDIRRLLEDYSKKDDHETFGLKELVRVINENYDALNAYSIVIFRDNYDIPVKDEAKTKTGESEEVYQYLALMICPVKALPVGLSPDSRSKNIVRNDVIKQLQAPAFGLIYPSFSDRSADYDHAFICCKGDNERSLCERLFKSKMEAPVKKEKPKKDVVEDDAPKTENIPDMPLKGAPSEDRGFSFKEDAVNNIDEALQSKRAATYQDESDDEYEQTVEVKEDKSQVVLDHVTERDINGKKFLLIPRDLLPKDVLEKILSL